MRSFKHLQTTHNRRSIGTSSDRGKSLQVSWNDSIPVNSWRIESCFERAWALAQLIEDSQLSPMQKLHALRTKIMPKLYHLLENSYTNQNQLHMMNRSLRKMATRILCLPEKATTAYINLNRLYGGPGLPDLVLTKAKMTQKSFVNAFNIKDSLVTVTQKLLIHGSADEEVIRAINQNKKAGLSEIAKETSLALQRIPKYLKLNIKLELHNDRLNMQLADVSYGNPWPMLHSLMTKRSLTILLEARDQGRYWRSLSSSPIATKAIYSFHTKFCEWRFIHRARLNLTPLRAAITWCKNKDVTN